MNVDDINEMLQAKVDRERTAQITPKSAQALALLFVN